jgi:hypothetical protein
MNKHNRSTILFLGLTLCLVQYACVAPIKSESEIGTAVAQTLAVETTSQTSLINPTPEPQPSPTPQEPQVPPLQLPVSITEATLKTYLVESFGITAYGGKAFCAYQLMGYGNTNDQDKALNLWVFCQEYYLEGEGLRVGSGVSLPVVIDLQGINGGYHIIGNKFPGDGANYGSDVRQLFPETLWDQIFGTTESGVLAYNQRAETLEQLAQQSALLYYLLDNPGNWSIQTSPPIP